MVPHLCRMVGVVNEQFKDIGNKMVEKLLKEFEYVDNTKNEKKISYLRFLCELAKFRVLELFKVLNIFKVLVDDFSVQNIELISLFIDNIGAYVHKNKETRFRFQTILDSLKKKFADTISSLPPHMVTKLKNSLDMCIPIVNKYISK